MTVSSRPNFPLSIVLLRAASWEFRGNKPPGEEIKAIKRKGRGAVKQKMTPQRSAMACYGLQQKGKESKSKLRGSLTYYEY